MSFVLTNDAKINAVKTDSPGPQEIYFPAMWFGLLNWRMQELVLGSSIEEVTIKV